MTPEGRTKRKISEVFKKYKSHGIYVYMPVPSGYGKSTIDYLGFIYGLGFAVEAKAQGEHPTVRQEGIIERIQESGTPVFVVNDNESLEVLDRWLTIVVNTKGELDEQRGRVHPYSGHRSGQYL